MTYGTSCVCGPPVGGSHARSSESPYFSCARGAVKTLDRASCSSANPRLLCSFPNPLPIFSAQSAASYHQHITCLLVGTTGGLEKGRPSSGSVGLKEIVFGEKRRRPVGDWRRPRIDEIKSPTGGGRNGTGWPWPGQERGGGASSLFSLEILHGRHTFAPLWSDRLRRPKDGQEVPACFLESARRLELPVHFWSRKENLERAREHEAAGNSRAAYECYQKAVDITPKIASDLIQVLKQEKVDYIVAPYEADAQMTFLSVNKLVDAVITEDSDLIPFGCSTIIFKMDKFGQGVEFQITRLERNRELDLNGFTKQMLLEMCILSGCDYLPSLPGMGVKRAHALIQKLKSYEKVIKHLRYSAVSVPPQYEENFKKAIWAFQFQRVYDPAIEDIVHLSGIPHGLSEDDFLGPYP
ncbi:exonuclease 1 [Lolium perenne]|uniref:exonuclease 1 n=1 Tax=Lolium perenne TaxID=4522 RepID=UPI003A99533D